MRAALARWAVVGAGFFLFGNLYAPQPLLPALERGWNAAAGAAGPGMSAPMLGLVLGSLLWPRTGLRAGAMLALGALGVALFAALGAWAPGPYAWAALRLGEGLAAAAVPGASFALLPRLFGSRAAAAAGWLVAANTVGGALGRAGAGALAERFGPAGALVLLALPLVGLAWAALPLEGGFTRGEARVPAGAGPLLAFGAGLLFANLFVANLMPYRLEAAGYGLAALGAFYLVYLGGTAGALLAGTLAGRLGPVRAGAAALGAAAAGTALLASRPLAGFALLLAGLFGLHALGGAAAGRRGAGTSGAYVSAYYLGGGLAGLVYPFFLPRPFGWALGFVGALLLLTAGLLPRALAPARTRDG
ncbi:major facilitator superfamily MFS_1 [Oceanithermus profundus DSM 14977]|uniref:Major facilitator superfamily MFS_1 n=1 Tax=Oceanithermus profundus (strain DSM 14977 / NBRC 100410 / VKM B-2274 / 506) TaxID=670487 RepID=E4UAB7_OCEP5|nr:MFS transporter [Oceanithermus profundus]ADR37560.1 major facilitator superfamily MFS_1 [Oceanithermus profundus DSM 14977]